MRALEARQLRAWLPWSSATEQIFSVCLCFCSSSVVQRLNLIRMYRCHHWSCCYSQCIDWWHICPSSDFGQKERRFNTLLKSVFAQQAYSILSLIKVCGDSKCSILCNCLSSHLDWHCNQSQNGLFTAHLDWHPKTKMKRGIIKQKHHWRKCCCQKYYWLKQANQK